jgi:hypothetical protein
VEYAIRTTQTFQQVIEALVSALEERGFTVRRSFDLQSALWEQADQGAHYCILMVKPASASDPDQRARILAIYKRKGRPILNLLRTVAPVSHHQIEGVALPLESALVDLLVEKGWWSMEESQAVVG